MGENYIQDPAEPYRADKEVETNDQPDSNEEPSGQEVQVEADESGTEVHVSQPAESD